MQTIIAGILANYKILGESNKKSIVIVHGWRRNFNDWVGMALKLSLKYKVYLIDLPGHGGSSELPHEPFDTFDFADFLVEFIKKMKIRKPILIGHSFGGKISVIAATKLELERLVLVDSSGITEKNLKTKLQIFLTKRFKGLFKFLPNKISIKIYKSIYSDAGNMVSSFKKIVVQDVNEFARKINVPTLIIWGDKDLEVTTSQAKTFNMLLKNSVLRIVWGTGHHPHLEKPEKFYTLLSEYI